MNCAELQRILPDVMEGHPSPDQAAHLRSCRVCSDLVSDLNTICQEARLLRACEEPSPRVWNSIEIALRAEGIIRKQEERRTAAAPTHGSFWRPAWMMPVAAAFLIAAGVIRYERRPAPQVAQFPAAASNTLSASVTVPMPGDDERFIHELSTISPARRGAYEAGLRNVNSYIEDAERSARNNPNDEEAQAYLMDAYEQKAMVYEMAMDRVQP